MHPRHGEAVAALLSAPDLARLSGARIRADVGKRFGMGVGASWSVLEAARKLGWSPKLSA